MVKSNKNPNQNKSKNKKELNKTKSKKLVYLDNASATFLDGIVLSKMNQAFKKYFANPSAIHNLGVESMKVLTEARNSVGAILGAHMDEIVFTSGATESNNLAVLGTISLASKKFKTPHVIISNIEHASILEVCKFLEAEKRIELDYLPVEPNGIVDPSKLKKLIKANTVLVSIMYANNEIGTIQPIREIAKVIRHYKKNNNYELYPVFHTDATQAINYLDINVLRLGVDLLSFNAGKIYGPKGVGVLFKKRGVDLSPINHGGDQEFQIRPGTENLPQVVGLEQALILIEKMKIKENKRLVILRDYFITKMQNLFEKSEIKLILNGDSVMRLPNNVNFTIPQIPSDLLLIELSTRGIHISEKSACKSGDQKNSHVLEAIHGDGGKIIHSLRFSLGRDTTKEDLNYVITSMSEILKKTKKWYI